MKKKILLVLSALTLILTLSSCNRHNLHTPTGDVSSTQAFATAGNVSITERQLYDRLRSQHGLDYINEHVKRFILHEQLAQINSILNRQVGTRGHRDNGLNDDEQAIYQDIVDASLRSIFNTDDLEVISNMSYNERLQAKTRFADSLFLQTGINIAPNDVVIMYHREPVNGHTNNFTITSIDLNRIVLDQNIFDVAAILFTKEEASVTPNTSRIDGEDNPFYISKDDIENQLERMLDFGTRTAIIVSFPNEASRDTLVLQAINSVRQRIPNASNFVLPEANVGQLPIANGPQEQLEITYFFFTLYKLRHDGRITEAPINASNTAQVNLEALISHMQENYPENFVFVNDEDGNEMVSRNFEIDDIFTDIENFQHTSREESNFDVAEGRFDSATTSLGNENFVTFLRIDYDREFPEDIENLDDYEDEFGREAREALEARILDIIRDNMVTSSFANMHINRIIDSEDFEITIYDPIIEFLFSRNRDNFSFNRQRQNTLVLSIRHYSRDDDGNRRSEPRKSTLTVNDFFSSLIERHATQHIPEMLINRWLVEEFGDHEQLPDNASSDFNTAFSQVARNFRNSEFRVLGLENYLLIHHGLGTRNEVINFDFKASALWDIIINDFEAFGQDFAVTRDGREYFNDAGDTIFHFFEELIARRFEEQFNLGIQHLLIRIDSNNDGNPDNPETFFHSLSTEQQIEFIETIQDLTFLIIREVEFLTGLGNYNTIEALQQIQRNFNGDNWRNPAGRIYHTDTPGQETLYWSREFRRWYNISLLAEDLGNVTQSNVTNFVFPFANRVRDLSDRVADMEYFDEDEGYLERFGITEDTVNGRSINIGIQPINTPGQNPVPINPQTTLTPTVFGFHILNVTQITERSSARFTPGDDWTVGGELRLRNIGVVLNPNAPTADQRVIRADAYSRYYETPGPGNTTIFNPEGDNPSASQLFVWFFESQRSGGATSGNTSIRNTISALFNPVIAQFNNNNFQTWRFIQYMDNIVIRSNFSDTTLADNINHYVNNILENLFHNYEDITNPEHYAFRDWFYLYTEKFGSLPKFSNNSNVTFNPIG